MKILQICSARELGGGERHLADLSNSLAERGHSVFAAIVPGSPLRKELSSLPKENIFEIPIRNSVDIFAGLRIARIVRKFDIDIIHAHVGRDYSLAAFASLRTGNTPFVLTRHVLFPLKKIFARFYGRASAFIAVSEAVARGLRDQNIFDQRKIVTIHNGIDTKRFVRDDRDMRRPAPLGVKPSRILVGMVGHLAPIKGQEDFIRAAAIIASKRDDVDFVIVGEDKSPKGENRQEIENLITEFGHTHRVHLSGWQDDVRPLLAAFDIFVSPSRSEPFGLVILEAMACGVPVIATASEGAVEIIEPEVTGILVPVADPDSLAIGITNLLDAPAERRRISENALRAVTERFSLQKMVDAVEELYTAMRVRSH
ncbi:MAG: glycosyltransferase family 4 protein [Pyrinomonadaceae bacterium]